MNYHGPPRGIEVSASLHGPDCTFCAIKMYVSTVCGRVSTVGGRVSTDLIIYLYYLRYNQPDYFNSIQE